MDDMLYCSAVVLPIKIGTRVKDKCSEDTFVSGMLPFIGKRINLALRYSNKLSWWDGIDIGNNYSYHVSWLTDFRPYTGDK